MLHLIIFHGLRGANMRVFNCQSGVYQVFVLFQKIIDIFPTVYETNVRAKVIWRLVFDRVVLYLSIFIIL